MSKIGGVMTREIMNTFFPAKQKVGHDPGVTERDPGDNEREPGDNH